MSVIFGFVKSKLKNVFQIKKWFKEKSQLSESLRNKKVAE